MSDDLFIQQELTVSNLIGVLESIIELINEAKKVLDRESLTQIERYEYIDRIISTIGANCIVNHSQITGFIGWLKNSHN